MPFYGVDEIVLLLDVSKTKAYTTIVKLTKELESQGFLTPRAGKIHKDYFCKRFNLSMKECDAYLKKHLPQKTAS